ncbi:MAG: xanthine dehydrogenase accessory protein XdhC [Robiginitomaculum sp.]|nr:MAG: xanthine dehydrogenase accessory protein XdhC [Robiginitomaculum sp.]
MFNWRETASDLLKQGEVFCLVTITATEGSTPRDTGTIMLVTNTNENGGDEYGTIGGGNLEYAAIKTARNCLESGHRQQTLDYILGPDVEQCCGGRVELSFSVVKAQEDMPDMPALKSASVCLFGVGHVGSAVAIALAPLPFTLRLYDNRNDKIIGGVLPYSDPVDAVSAAAKHTLFLVMTHDHSLDYGLVSAILKRGDFAFLGLIGSKTKRARFMSRLKKDGFTNRQLSRLTCPIGIQGIQGKEPEIIAASVAAQLLQKLEASYGENT